MPNKLSKENRQVILLYICTLSGVLIGVLSSIINTRFLPPEDYGDVRYVQNIVSFIASLLLFGYFLSGSRLLALSKSIEYNRKVKGAMVIILLITSIVLCLSTFICALLHFEKKNLFYLFLVTIPVCFYPLLLNYVNTTAQGDNQIGRLSIVRLLPVALYVPLGFAVYNQFGASSNLMMALQWGIYTVICLIVIISTKPLFSGLTQVWVDLQTENKSYGFQLYIGSLVMVATNYIAGITLGLFNSDNTQVGFYTLALTVTSPLATLPAIIGTTYFKKFASLPSIPTNVLKMTILLTLVSCIVFVAIIKPLVVFLYTEDYAPVGGFAALLAVGFSIHGIGDMINRYLGSHGMGKAIRNSSILNGLFKVFGYTVLVYAYNVNGAVWTTIFCSVLYTLSLCYYYYKFVNYRVL